jgi:hypothetical protein
MYDRPARTVNRMDFSDQLPEYIPKLPVQAAAGRPACIGAQTEKKQELGG